MHFLIHLTIALISIIVIVLACILFTNAIEYFGNKLKLGNNATGSILAVIGTGLPETIVPIVAIFGMYYTKTPPSTAQDIALGAILGSPFMLSTLALFLLGCVIFFQKRNSISANSFFILRNYKYFISAYVIAFIFPLISFIKIKIFIPIFLVSLYFIFVYRTIVKSRLVCVECECEELYFHKKTSLDCNFALIAQLLISLLLLIISSHYFVDEIKYFSELFNIPPAILAFLITPFATELPECVNSIIWIKQRKDELALANILGAMVFQATMLFSIGILVTPWSLNKVFTLNILSTMLCAITMIVFLLLKKKLNTLALLLCGLCYLTFLIFLFF